MSEGKHEREKKIEMDRDRRTTARSGSNPKFQGKSQERRFQQLIRHGENKKEEK